MHNISLTLILIIYTEYAKLCMKISYGTETSIQTYSRSKKAIRKIQRSRSSMQYEPIKKRSVNTSFFRFLLLGQPILFRLVFRNPSQNVESIDNLTIYKQRNL